MNFNNIDELKLAGFIGFKTIKELELNNSIIPIENGVYLVLNINKKKVEFQEIGSGGFFKGIDPNVSISILEENWVDNTIVLYIGKANSLKKRLIQYIQFGNGRNVGHYGGRYIWQIRNCKTLVVCWKILKNDNPKSIESDLIKEYKRIYIKRPFANLQG